jgi:DNA-binding MarR family transcriptional regulator
MSVQAQATTIHSGEVAALLHERFSRLSRQLRHMELPSGMTPERLSTLTVIDRSGPISVTALADREMVRPATMSRMVSALVDDGLVRRREDKADGRGVLVTVTPKGRRIYRRAHQQRLEQLAEALNELSPEQLAAMKNLASVLERLTLLLDKPAAT